MVTQDAAQLATLGVTYEQIADAIHDLLQGALDRKYGPDWRERTAHDEDHELFYAVWGRKARLPTTWLAGEKGYTVAQFQVLLNQYRGGQDCPWNCRVDVKFASFDFVIVNRNNGLYFTGPALITHLIREHHFFEGRQSFYRVDPLRAARVLELV